MLHALCGASNLRAKEKKKEKHCSSRLSRSRFTLSRTYESCLACQRLFLTKALLALGVEETDPSAVRCGRGGWSCCLIVDIQVSGISMPLFLLMSFG